MSFRKSYYFTRVPLLVIKYLPFATATAGLCVSVGKLLQTWPVEQLSEPEPCSVTIKEMDPADSRVNRLQRVGGTSGTLGIPANYFNFLLLTGARSIKRRR